MIRLIKEMNWVLLPQLDRLAANWKKSKAAKDAIPYFIEALKDKNKDVRKNALQILPEIVSRDQEPAPIIESLLTARTNNFIITSTLKALDKIGETAKMQKVL